MNHKQSVFVNKSRTQIFDNQIDPTLNQSVPNRMTDFSKKFGDHFKMGIIKRRPQKTTNVGRIAKSEVKEL